VQLKDMYAIENQVLTDVPVVALSGRANWLDYQTGTFTGFPSASDPTTTGARRTLKVRC